MSKRNSRSAAPSPGGIDNFDYAVLLCDAMADTRALCRAIMGFPIEPDRASWVSFRVGAQRFQRHIRIALKNTQQPNALAI